MDKNRLEELNESLKTKFSLVVLDGVTDYNCFAKSKRKILWIMKEANQSGGQHTDDLRVFHKNVVRYKNWRRTYKPIIKTSYGILNDINYLEIPNEDQILDVLSQVAFINVKKTGGTSKSGKKVINDHYVQNKDIIVEQINCIQPDIIINCSRVWQLFTEISTSELINVERFNVARYNNAIIVNAFHPNQRKINQIEYFNTIMKCIDKGLYLKV